MGSTSPTAVHANLAYGNPRVDEPALERLGNLTVGAGHGALQPLRRVTTPNYRAAQPKATRSEADWHAPNRPPYPKLLRLIPTVGYIILADASCGFRGVIMLPRPWILPLASLLVVCAPLPARANPEPVYSDTCESHCWPPYDAQGFPPDGFGQPEPGAEVVVSSTDEDSNPASAGGGSCSMGGATPASLPAILIVAVMAATRPRRSRRV